jgi:transposase-like protein
MAPMSREVRERVVAALKEGGKTQKDVARDFHLSASAVYRVARQLRDAAREEEADTASVASAESDISVRPEAVQEFHRNANVFASDLGLEAEANDDEEAAGHGKAAEVAVEAQKAAEKMLRQQVLAGSGLGAPVAQPLMRNIVLHDRIPDTFSSRFAALEESTIDRGHVIQRIMFNCEHFAPLIRQIIGQDTQTFIQSLMAKSDRELESLLQIIERTRSVGNLANTFKHTFYAAATGAEVLTKQFLRMRTDGFVTALQAQDEEIGMALKELAIEQYDKFNKMNRPEVRLGMTFVMTLIQVDSTNRMRAALGAAARPATVPETTAEKFADL